MDSKTTSLTLPDGNTIEVADLPKNIRDVIDFFDSLKTDLQKTTYEISKINMAILATQHKIMDETTKFLKSKESEFENGDNESDE